MNALNSWERVKLAIDHQDTDRVPVEYRAVPEITTRLLEEWKLDDIDRLREHLGIDCRHVAPRYVGPAERAGVCGADGASKDIWGVVRKPIKNEFATYLEIAHYPLAGANTAAEIDGYDWPKIEWLDVSHMADQIREYDSKQKRWIWHRCGGHLNFRGTCADWISFLSISSRNPIWPKPSYETWSISPWPSCARCTTRATAGLTWS